MSNTPKVRFAGFTGDWEQRKFDEIADRASATSSDPALPRVEYEDIISGAGRLNKDVATKESTKVGISFHAGDVLYGKLRPYLQNWLLPTFSGLAVGDFWVLQPQNVDSAFLYRLVQSCNFDEIANQSTGTKMPRADWKLVSRAEFSVPQSIDEQALIGHYFNDLDNLITLQQHEYEKLVSLKSACLDKMFPKNGSKVPELRVSRSSKPWNVMKIKGIITEKLSNGIINHPGNEDSFVRHINVTNMYTPDKVHVEDLTYSAYDDIAVERCNVEYGDIFMTRSSVKPEGIAEPNVLLDTGKYVFDDHLIRMKINRKENDPLFVKIALETPFIRRQFISRSKTTAFTTIGQDDIVDCLICLPELSEQIKIAELFSNIDSLISLNQRKLMKFQQFKQAMMHNMFV